MQKRMATLSSGMPFLEEQIHAGARIMGQYDQSARELRILESLIQVRTNELDRLQSACPVFPGPAIRAMGRDRAQAMTSPFGVPQLIARASESLARAQHEASYLANSLRAKDVIVRCGKGFHIQTERDPFAAKYCHRPQSALREMTRLSLVQAEAQSIDRRLALLHTRQRVGLLSGPNSML